MKKIKITDLIAKKNREKIVMITAYDALFARLFDDYADMILVGDSLNMSFGGANETLGISVDEMIYHARAVQRGAKRAFLVVDMPFGSTITPEISLKNAVKIYKNTLCDAVKIEGSKEIAPTIKLLDQNGIAVIAHIGLKPQLSRQEGGYRVAGKDDKEAKSILEDALALESAGAKMVLIEGVPSDLAKEITKALKVPTIGIGAGASCDGQVLVWSDAFGFYDEFRPKFVKRYMDGANLIREAMKNYADEVRNIKFPSQEYEYTK
ncbi:MAG: 3-methyl-2-oxobutanoate hydroxymethyltransferase [Campylobacter lanienae]|uniref:3-methyl-2-oxobutanoate hydroxymethyltransferase n=1 Tax=Campylobacter lanienae TaxID=75658 RepID=UPI00242C93D6|nr:3-methyl-2-oxobutanoate hydroxymethyltransferase [Campylobacter lanienae]MCI5539764.1 3-methyl-2-oxobutanoate hydroxymethyltransferase [Campylobacter lanienae]MDD7514529.1 3-methyl-2-oxobutanoate hydroxymethyltransferase [Campylobacter lanienae]